MVDPSLDATGLASTPAATALLVHSRVSSGFWPGWYFSPTSTDDGASGSHRPTTIIPFACANAGAAAIGQPARAGPQSESPRVKSLGSTLSTRSTELPTTVPRWLSNTCTCPRCV